MAVYYRVFIQSWFELVFRLMLVSATASHLICRYCLRRTGSALVQNSLEYGHHDFACPLQGIVYLKCHGMQTLQIPREVLFLVKITPSSKLILHPIMSPVPDISPYGVPVLDSAYKCPSSP